jgi:DNA polymerase bacteriophage-type
MKLWLDTETYADTPIKHGTYAYLQDCELMIVTYAIDGGPVQVWDRTSGSAAPYELIEAMLLADEVIAHNAMFDRGVIAKHFGVHAPELARWRCTMVRALAHSLPGSLDKLCDILGVPQDKAKHKRGKDLIRLFCMPRPKNMKLRRATRETHPAEWAEFIAYAAADIEAMREIDKRMPQWNYQGAELALWHLDQQINDRGFAVDLDLANAAICATDIEQERLAQCAHDMTNGDVTRATQRDAMLEHICIEYGIFLDDLKGSTVERMIEDADIPEPLKELLRVRAQASTTSTSKYKRVINGATCDGRLKGTLQFCGAGRTGRWSGRTFQPQNLPSRGLLPPDEVEFGIDALKAHAADLLFDNVMHLTSSAIRGCIVAPAGKKLVVADLSNIEGRDQAWLAGEEWKLQAFRDFDTVQTIGGEWLTGPQLRALHLSHEYPELALDAKGEPIRLGHDLYKLAYSKSFGIRPEDVTKNQRQVGKVQELALGYEGGVGAFLTFSLAYSIDLEAMAVEAYDNIPDDIRRVAGEFYDWTLKQKRSDFGLSRTAFVVCDSFKRLWRQAHPNIAALWKELEAAAVDAVESPGRTLACRKFKVRRDGQWLRIGLPSGRALCYPQPRVDDGKLSYMGVNQYTRQWCRLKTYGGKLFENCCQAVARDVMAANMPTIQSSGYSIVLTVHDEVLTEAADMPDFNPDHLSALLAANPAWAPDMPLAAAGFESYRYRKD